MSNYYRKITALFPSVLRGKNRVTFPSVLRGNMRIIFPKQQLLLLSTFALSLSLVAFLTFFAFVLMLYFKTKTERTQALKSLSLIEKQVEATPNYPDLYVAASIAAQKVGNHEKALLYAIQASKLDPLNKDAQKLKNSLKN